MTPELRVHFHLRSPYSRIGLHKLAMAEIDRLVSLTLHPLTKAAGEEDLPNPTRTKPRLKYILADMPRETARAGLPLAMPRPFDPDYLPGFGYFYAAQDAGRGLAFASALSELRYGEGLNVSEPDVLARAAGMAGVSAEPLSAPDTEARLLSDQEVAEKDGAFGVPFAVLETSEGAEPFFGQDRFDQLIERVRTLG